MNIFYRRPIIGFFLLALVVFTGENLFSGVLFPFHQKVQDTGGMEVTLENLAGKRGIIVVYTSSMPDCKKKIARFVRLSKSFEGGDVPFSAIDITPLGMDAFLKNLPDDRGAVIFRKDLAGSLGRTLGVKIIPVTFFLSPEGRIVSKYESVYTWDSDEFKEKVERFIYDAE